MTFRPGCSYEERGLNGTWTGEERGGVEDGVKGRRGGVTRWYGETLLLTMEIKKDACQRSEKNLYLGLPLDGKCSVLPIHAMLALKCVKCQANR